MIAARFASAAVAVAAVATLAACGSDDAPKGTSTPASQAPAAGPAAVKVGEPFQISNRKGPTGTVTLVQTEMNPVCSTRYGTVSPPSGTNVALLFELQTTANPPTKYISDAWFQELTPDGYTKKLTMANDLCIADRERMTNDPLPNSKYRGWVLVDVSNPSSSLLMSDIWDGRTPPETHRIPITS
ncbi:hypothetical protein [Nocardia wallacei]|uniref:hypothetical protein n=1 Tax=Nocardia wallacei TaxID=480035 RepID=UPI002458F1C3|nr:hypothetical protein [Nocardia wallacei]